MQFGDQITQLHCLLFSPLSSQYRLYSCFTFLSALNQNVIPLALVDSFLNYILE